MTKDLGTKPMCEKKYKVIVDTDIGIDDAEAITYLSASKDVEILALTLVAGNGCMSDIAPNAEKMLAFLGKKDIPLYTSGSFSLGGKYLTSDGYFGKSGFAEIELPETDKKCCTDMVSSQALVHYALKYPNEIDFIFIGPLTNLGMAFLLNNDFPSLVKSITIMGSDRSEVTFRQPNIHAEFNALCDPISYSILQSCFSKVHQPIRVIDWTACYKHILPFSLIENIQKNENAKNRHWQLFKILTDKNNEYIRKNFWEEGFITADLFAAVIVNHPDIVVKKERSRIKSVEISGERAGHIVYEADPEGNVELIHGIDVSLVEKYVIETFSSSD